MRIQLSLLALAVAIAFPSMANAMSPEDREVAQRIATNLEQSGQLQGFRVGVKFQDGTAWLTGTVSDMEQLRSAVEVTKTTQGVTRIINKLKIETPDGANVPPEVQLTANAVIPQQTNPVSHEIRSSEPVQSAGFGRVARRCGNMPVPIGHMPTGSIRPVSHDHAVMPGYAWPSYAAAPNYAALTYPKQYSPAAWPYIGPFYPYPQVPLGWRKVTLEWDDGWWMLDFKE